MSADVLTVQGQWKSLERASLSFAKWSGLGDLTVLPTPIPLFSSSSTSKIIIDSSLSNKKMNNRLIEEKVRDHLQVIKPAFSVREGFHFCSTVIPLRVSKSCLLLAIIYHLPPAVKSILHSQWFWCCWWCCKEQGSLEKEEEESTVYKDYSKVFT